jgi:hypothetical protein
MKNRSLHSTNNNIQHSRLWSLGRCVTLPERMHYTYFHSNMIAFVLLIFIYLHVYCRESLLEIEEEKDETDDSSVVLSRCK